MRKSTLKVVFLASIFAILLTGMIPGVPFGSATIGFMSVAVAADDDIRTPNYYDMVDKVPHANNAVRMRRSIDSIKEMVAEQRINEAKDRANKKRGIDPRKNNQPLTIGN